jgi:hypothetical protein
MTFGFYRRWGCETSSFPRMIQFRGATLLMDVFKICNVRTCNNITLYILRLSKHLWYEHRQLRNYCKQTIGWATVESEFDFQKTRHFSLHNSVQTSSKVWPISYSIVTVSFFPMGEAAKVWKWQLIPSSTKITNESCCKLLWSSSSLNKEQILPLHIQLEDDN